MSLISSSIKFPVSVIVGVLIACMAGVIALTNIPIQLTPEVSTPIITVTTNWFGASPEEIEKEIIDEQEKYLKSIQGLRKMNSESSSNQGVVSLEFPVGTDITSALLKVTNKLAQVPSYPENADRPIVSATGPLEGAIAWFVIHSDGDIFVPSVYSLIEEQVQPRMERVEGIAAINIFGGLEEEIHVTFDPELLASMGITISQLTRALQNENRDISAGDFGEGKRRYVVRTLARYESIESVEETIIGVRSGAPVRVIDVADVGLGYQKPTAQVRHFGSPSIAMNAQRQVGANVLDITEELLAVVDGINKDILNPRGLNLVNVYRETIYINSSIDLVLSNMYFGSFLAILALFFFLRSPTSIMIIGVSIPISIITTFLIMYLFGRTINVISLAGMAFAVGMVVDNSIVVLENIYRHMQMGKDRWKAALDGSSEVWGAILASTVTTVAVFLPIIFIEERAGQLFRDIAIAISSAIVISLIVATTVIPTFSSRALKISSSKRGVNSGTSKLDMFARRISNVVDYINSNMRRRIATILGIVFVSLGLSFILLPESEYLPNGNQNLIFAFMLPPPGYNLDEMVALGESIESQVKHLWETPPEESDDLPGGGVENFFYVSFAGQAFMGIVGRDGSRVRELEPVANEAMYSIPGVFGFARQASIFSRGFAGTRSVRIDVTGPELPKILSVAGQIFGKVGLALPGSSSRPIPGLDLGNPEVRIIPNKARAADVGMTAADIGQSVNALVDGAIVSTYRHEGRELNLTIKGDDMLSSHTQDIEQLPMATPSGRIITLGDVADIDFRQGPVQINHVERQRAVSIETVLPNDIPLERAIQIVEDSIVGPIRASGQLGSLYNISFAGAADDLTRLIGTLRWNFVIALALTFLLLSALFQSFVYPLVIMLTVPLATFGGVLGLRAIMLFDKLQQLDILTMLGFVILIGTVINNAILIVHHALHLMREGQDPRSAVKESVRVRVRPIFMSTGTSALGMLPLILMPGAGSELYRGLGSVVVGGLVLSSIITLVLTPLVFSFAVEIVGKIKVALGVKSKSLGSQAVVNPG
ncbi:MAG: efflux RND transporter permease subunit [candidate division Zixibacteria bacterium]|nr:efflux RND transporter permease subunit [candidate division Zixibacteria bacterium]